MLTIIGYSKEGPCRKFTLLFFRDKKFVISLGKRFWNKKDKVKKNKIR